MKRLILAIGLGVALSVNAAVVSTNITASSVSPSFMLLTNRASIYQIELVGGALSPATVLFYDNNSMADPYLGTNVVLGSRVTSASYSTNLVTTYIGSNGVTNTWTNAGVFTYSVTNAASTNALNPIGVFVVNANQTAVYNVDQLHTKGVVVQVLTNVGVTFFYRTSR